LASLVCAGGESDSCLSQAQIDAVQKLYADQKDPANGATLYGVLPGAEAVKDGWDAWLTGTDGHPGAGFGFMWNYLAFMVMNDPKLDLAKVTTADIVRGERQFEPVIDADSADLSSFKQHGGKLIQYHGWNDPGIAPGFSVEYRERLLAKMGPADDFYRLYMVPGMLHCGGGQAPTYVDWQAALEGWVEKSEAPGTLVASDGKGATQTLEPFH
jgi:feruloyl esterase